LLDHGETCIRLLGETAGDRASAHAINVAVISMLLGKAFGLGAAEMLDLGVGAVLHDIGKLDVPERLRHSDSHMSSSEAMMYQEHVVRGVAQARRMGLAEGARRVVEQHHEHADGTGFPLRLGSDRMTVGARIVALVNRYDNLCNPNVPSRALTPHEALSLLFAQGKSKFDAAVLAGFIKMMGVYPPGSAVQLSDERYAIVVAVNSSRPLKPRVLVHDRAASHEEALLLDLESEPLLGIRRSLKPIALPSDALEYLSPRPRIAYFFEPARELEAESVG
jgi:putative nucleotidyltransferase with HDIG domain